jgi:hypothetical protein
MARRQEVRRGETRRDGCAEADGQPAPGPRQIECPRTAHRTLTLQGISNQNGKLTQGTGASTFQQSCGNIQILINNGPNISLSALCRTTNGSSVATSQSLNNIANSNGTLVQQ